MKGILFRPEILPAKFKAIEQYGEAETRRLGGLKEINLEPNNWILGGWDNGYKAFVFYKKPAGGEKLIIKPRYRAGETVYIKEAWATEKRYDYLRPSEISHIAKIFYVSDGVGEWPTNLSIGKLRSPLFMPEWAARHFITITDMRAERLQEITIEACISEGCDKVIYGGDPRQDFISLWNSINKDYPWELNPWVFAYRFKWAAGYKKL